MGGANKTDGLANALKLCILGNSPYFAKTGDTELLTVTFIGQVGCMGEAIMAKIMPKIAGAT